MKAPSTLSFPQLDEAQDVSRVSGNSAFQGVVKGFVEQLANIINGRLELGRYNSGTTSVERVNVSCYWYGPSTTPVTPLDDFVITHNLGRVPIGWIVVNKNKACDLYFSASTTTTLTLKCTVASASVVVMVI